MRSDHHHRNPSMLVIPSQQQQQQPHTTNTSDNSIHNNTTTTESSPSTAVTTNNNNVLLPPSITHIEFIKAVIHKPIFVLQKDFSFVQAGRLVSSLLPKSTIHSCYIEAIEEEMVTIVSTDKREKLHRLYVKSAEVNIDPAYFDVGWIVSEEVNHCMICNASFSFFLHRYHCYACGNVICKACSNQTAYICELPDYPALRACNMCYFGQEVIHCTPNRKRKFSIVPNNSSTTTSAVDASKGVPPPEVSALEKLFSSIALMNSGETTTTTTLATAPAAGESTITHASPVSHPQPAVVAPPPQQQRDSLISSSESESSPQYQESLQTALLQICGPLLQTSSAAERYHAMNKLNSQWDRIVPNVGFVIKTKNEDNKEKIFINICSHSRIPFNTPVATTTNASGTDKPDGCENDDVAKAHRLIYMTINPAILTQNVKDTKPCLIYDILVHPDELYIVAIDASGDARKQLCKQILTAIQLYDNVPLDPDYTALRLLSNYKFPMDPSASDMKGGNNNNTNSKPRACMIPQKDVFEFFRCVQTIPVEEFKAIKGGEKAGAASSTKKYLDDDVSVNDTEEDAENGQLTHLKRSDSFMSVVADTDSTSSTSSLSFGSGKRFSFLRRNSTLFGHDTLPSTNDDSPAEVQYAIRGMIAPRDELEQVFVQQNFDAISSLCNNYEMPWKDLIIRPQAGFVVKTQRRLLAKKSFVSIAGTTEGINSTNGPSTAVVTASILYLNICHHAQVGMITKINQQQNGTPNKQIEESIPFILGSWKESTQRVQQHQVIQIATLDIVIPSHYIELVKKDVKQQEIIAMAILQALHTMNIALETNYSFPAIGSQYVFNIDHILSPTSASSSNTNHHNNSDNQFVIPEVFNITEEEKTNYAIAFVGKFYKQGYTACHSYWKERHFLLTESTLQYYALNGSFQYNYHAEEGIQFTYDDDSNEFDSPKGSFPFTIVNNFYQATEQKYLICCVAQEQTRQQLHTIFQLRQAMYLTMKGLICVPTRKCGYLQKLGHWRKNWKSRYFLLDFGELSYYQIKDQFPLLAKWKRHQLAKRQSSTSNNRNSSITQQQKDEENDQSRLTTASTQPSPLLDGNNSNSEVFYSILKKTQQLKGKISLQDAKVNIVWTNDAKTGQLNRNIFRLRITIPNNNKRSKDDDFDLLLQMQSLEELHAWYEVVEEHIHYANQYNN